VSAQFRAAVNADCTEASNSFGAGAAAQMECLITDLGRMVQQRNEALREVTRAHHEALLRLARAAEFRDDDTGVHLLRIGFLAEALALLAGQTPEFAERLRWAAPMHDIGKIGVPDEVLKKPGAYSPEERKIMNGHAMMGAQILGGSRSPLFQMAAEVALNHHERWDGSGYPLGLVGEAIPLSGRLVAVVDFFDALTMNRCYRPAFPDSQALAMMAAQRGLAFDPWLVDLALAHAEDLIALRDHINRSPPEFGPMITQI